jgi:AraC-like DNA-binding protein
LQHIEFFHIDHFENNYHRVKPAAELESFIDFYWETRFDHLWKDHPKGFSDALFPNIGYTYIFNLGTPFVMQVGENKFNMKTDGFLPRHQSIECFHQAGNCLFGIKFRVSPIIFEKEVNFAEYNKAIYPLSYLIEKNTLQTIKELPSFQQRAHFLNEYYIGVIKKYAGSFLPISIVSGIIQAYNNSTTFKDPVAQEAGKNNISSRTLQRYFEKCTGLSTKKTLQILRIRKAVAEMVSSPATFDYKKYGYYDYSHFYKHLQQFLPKEVIKKLHQG